MKLSNTTKVAILTIISVGILIWGYTYLKGKNLFNRSTQVYVEYDQIDGLSVSSPVKVNGFKIGIVSSIYLKEDYSGKIIVVLDISEKLNVSKTGAVARIESASLMGGKQVVILFPKGKCSGEDCLQSGDKIQGEVVSLLGSMTSDLDPYIEKAERGFEAVDSILKSWSNRQGAGDGGIAGSLNDIQAILSNLNATSQSLKLLIAASSLRIDGTLANLESVTSNLKASNNDIQKMLANAADFTEELKKVELQKTVGGADNAIAELQTTLANVNKAVNELNGVLAKANSNEGSLGLLLTDDGLYQNLDQTMIHLNLLLEDIRMNPARYTRILSKNRPPYQTSPTPPNR